MLTQLWYNALKGSAGKVCAINLLTLRANTSRDFRYTTSTYIPLATAGKLRPTFVFARGMCQIHLSCRSWLKESWRSSLSWFILMKTSLLAICYCVSNQRTGRAETETTIERVWSNMLMSADNWKVTLYSVCLIRRRLLTASTTRSCSGVYKLRSALEALRSIRFSLSWRPPRSCTMVSNLLHRRSCSAFHRAQVDAHQYADDFD